MKRFAYVLLLAAAAAPAQPVNRAEVQAQRKSVEQQFAREEAECRQRFAVSACLESLRLRRREALAPIVAREHELAADERRERAQAQARRVQERELAASAPEEGRPRDRLQPGVPAPPASHPVRARQPEQAAQAVREAERRAQAEAARRREQARERDVRQQQRVEAHEERERRRNKPPAAPLPIPGASAASR